MSARPSATNVTLRSAFFIFLFHDLLIGHSLVEFRVGHLTGPFVFEKNVFTRCRPALQEVEEMDVKQMGEGGGGDQQNVALDFSSFLVLHRFIAIHIRILLNSNRKQTACLKIKSKNKFCY